MKTVAQQKEAENLPAAPQAAVPALAGLPPSLAERMAKDAGRGVSRAQEDNLVPIIGVLQQLSPAVNRRNPAYVEGAEAGDILMKNAPQPLVKGTEGYIFQPCYFSKDWVEWVPRDSGGGFVARHPDCPQTAKKVVDPKNPNKARYVMPNNNEVIETRYHVGFVHLPSGQRLPYVIALSSSGHTVSRQWMFMMNSKQLPGGGVPPSFGTLWRLRTKERANSAGQTWFVYDITDCGFVQTTEDYDRGEGLERAMASGEKVIDAPEEPDHAGDVGSAGASETGAM